MSSKIYAVICTDASPAVQWQCELLEHTWQAVGQPGELIRLVAAPPDVRLPEHAHARVVRTAPSNVHPDTGDAYVPYNRLFSFAEWLRTERPDGSVLVLDPDMVFRAPLSTEAELGRPIGQRWIDFGRGATWLAEHVQACPADVQAITWPMLIRTADLERLLPHWIARTSEVRRVLGRWESDMFALVLAAADVGLRFEADTLCAWMNWPESTVAGAPLVHYCQSVEDAAGRVLFEKRQYRPWAPLACDPSEAALSYGRDLLEILGAYAAERGHGSIEGPPAGLRGQSRPST